MLLQLLLVGYFLTYIFETTEPIVIILLVAVMIGVSSLLHSGRLRSTKVNPTPFALISIRGPGVILLLIVTQFVLKMPRWFEPSLVVPIAGMIFANSMNTVSLAAERFESGGCSFVKSVTGAEQAGDHSVIFFNSSPLKILPGFDEHGKFQAHSGTVSPADGSTVEELVMKYDGVARVTLEK